MKLLFVAAEVPFSKTGLGRRVIGALLRPCEKWCSVRVILPYDMVETKFGDQISVLHF